MGIQVITWITDTKLGRIGTIQDQTQPFLEQYKAKLNHYQNNTMPNSTIIRTIQGQTQPFPEQCTHPISGELKLVCVIHVITVIQVQSFEKTRIRQFITWGIQCMSVTCQRNLSTLANSSLWNLQKDLHLFVTRNSLDETAGKNQDSQDLDAEILLNASFLSYFISRFWYWLC